MQSSLTGVSSPPFGASHLAHLCRFTVRAPTFHQPRRFSRQSGTSRLHPIRGSPSSLSFPGVRICLYPHRLRTWTGYSLSQRAAPPASRLGLQVGGAGILTGCPSATPFGLTLGPAFPYADLPSVGSLGLPGGRFLTYLSLLMPGFSLLCSPSPLTAVTSPRRERSPTNLHLCVGSVASVLCFSPVISSARNRSTSELLRTP